MLPKTTKSIQPDQLRTPLLKLLFPRAFIDVHVDLR